MFRILIVEDNPDNMDLMCWILEEAGYQFDGVITGEQCLKQLEQQHYDLVLMDISLPGMNGKQVTEHIRENPSFSSLPVIACTAHAVKQEEDAILASGVDEIITKPVDEQLLLETLSLYLPADQLRSV